MKNTIEAIEDFISRSKLLRTKSISLSDSGFLNACNSILAIIEDGKENHPRPKGPVNAPFFPQLDEIQVDFENVEPLGDLEHLRIQSLFKEMEKALFVKYNVHSHFYEKPTVYLDKTIFTKIMVDFVKSVKS